MAVKPSPRRYLPPEAKISNLPTERAWRHPANKGAPETRYFEGKPYTIAAYAYDSDALSRMSHRVARAMPGVPQRIVRSTLRGQPIRYIYTKGGRRITLTK